MPVITLRDCTEDEIEEAKIVSGEATAAKAYRRCARMAGQQLEQLDRQGQDIQQLEAEVDRLTRLVRDARRSAQALTEALPNSR